MKSKIIQIDPMRPNPEIVSLATQHILAGEIVIVPVDTTYTLGVDARNTLAIQKVLEVKQRWKKPLHVVVESLEAAKQICEATPIAERLAQRYLPGPLTLVLRQVPGAVPDILTFGLKTIGIRVPNTSFCTALSKELGIPYTTTSANLSDGVTPYDIDTVLGELHGQYDKIALFIDAGPTPTPQASTVIDLSGDFPKVLRPGPITEPMILEVIADLL